MYNRIFFYFKEPKLNITTSDCIKCANLFRVLFIILFLSSGILNAQWHWQNPLPQGNTLNGVNFFNQDEGIVIGIAGTIMVTTDGGINWTSKKFQGLDNPYNDISFANSTTGLIGGNGGTILKTTDGGNSWEIGRASCREGVTSVVAES